jgi:hypothetical protein
MPCQWMEVASASRLVTRAVSTSPCRNRRHGPGTEPFAADAMRDRPVTLTDIGATTSDTRAPLGSSCPVVAGREAARTIPAVPQVTEAKPCTKRRRFNGPGSAGLVLLSLIPCTFSKDVCGAHRLEYSDDICLLN